MLHLRIARRTDERAAWDIITRSSLTQLDGLGVAVDDIYGQVHCRRDRDRPPFKSPVLIQESCARGRCIS